MPDLTASPLAALGGRGFRLDGPLFHVREFPDGDLLVATQRSLRRLDPVRGEARWCVPALPNHVALSPGGTRIAWNRGSTEVGVLDAATGELCFARHVSGVIAALGWRGPREDALVVACHDGRVMVLDGAGEPGTRVEVRDGPAEFATFVEGGRAALSLAGGQGSSLVRHDLRTGSGRVLVEDVPGQALAMGTAPAGDAVWVLSQEWGEAGFRCRLAWYAGPRYQERWVVEVPSGADRVRVCSDGSALALQVGNPDDPDEGYRVQVRASRDGALLLERPVDPRAVFALAPDGSRLALGMVAFMEVAVPEGAVLRRSAQELCPPGPVPERWIRDLRYDASGRLLGVTGHESEPWELLDLDAGVSLATRTPARYSTVRFHPYSLGASTWVVTEQGEGGLVEELIGDELVPLALAAGGTPIPVGPTSGGGLVLHATISGIVLREMDTGRAVAPLRGHRPLRADAAVAPGGGAVALALCDGRVLRVDPGDPGSAIRLLAKLERPVQALAFLGDETRLVLGLGHGGLDGSAQGLDQLLVQALLDYGEEDRIREPAPPRQGGVQVRSAVTGEVLEEVGVPVEYFRLDCVGEELGLHLGSLRTVVRPGEEPSLVTRRGPPRARATRGLPGGRLAVETEDGRLWVGEGRDPAPGEDLVDLDGNPYGGGTRFLLASLPGEESCLVRDPDGAGLGRWDPRAGLVALEGYALVDHEPVAAGPGAAWLLTRVGNELQVHRPGEEEPAARREVGDLDGLQLTVAPDGGHLLIQAVGMGAGLGAPSAWLFELPSLRMVASWPPDPCTFREGYWFTQDSRLHRIALTERLEAGQLHLDLGLWSWDPESEELRPAELPEASWVARPHEIDSWRAVDGGGLLVSLRKSRYPVLVRRLGPGWSEVELAIESPRFAPSALLHPGTSRLAISGAGEVHLLDADSGTELARLEVAPGDQRQLAWSESGRILTLVQADRTLRAWELEEPEEAVAAEAA
jgi:hypothetical protein